MCPASNPSASAQTHIGVYALTFPVRQGHPPAITQAPQPSPTSALPAPSGAEPFCVYHPPSLRDESEVYHAYAFRLFRSGPSPP